MTESSKPYGVWLVKGFARPRERERTRTFEESLAFVRESAVLSASWDSYEIRHDSGRRWWWTMQGRHGILHTEQVDKRPEA